MPNFAVIILEGLKGQDHDYLDYARGGVAKVDYVLGARSLKISIAEVRLPYY